MENRLLWYRQTDFSNRPGGCCVEIEADKYPNGGGLKTDYFKKIKRVGAVDES